MKGIAVFIMIALIATLGACHSTEDANEKLGDCLEAEYGEDAADEEKDQWELDCEDGEEECDECVDCIMDKECDEILEGGCNDSCQ